MRRQPAEGGGNAQRGPRDERDDQQRRRPHRLVPERERDIVITTRPQLLPVRVRNKLTAAAPPPWPAARATPGRDPGLRSAAPAPARCGGAADRKSTRLNSSH